MLVMRRSSILDAAARIWMIRSFLKSERDLGESIVSTTENIAERRDKLANTGIGSTRSRYVCIVGGRSHASTVSIVNFLQRRILRTILVKDPCYSRYKKIRNRAVNYIKSGLGLTSCSLIAARSASDGEQCSAVLELVDRAVDLFSSRRGGECARLCSNIARRNTQNENH